MRKLIYAILVGIAALLVGVGLTHPVVGHAAEVPVTGLSAGDAVIKDANGKVVTGQGPFDRYQSYSVNYDWQIPDGVKLAGNTSTVSVPAGLEPNADISFDITDSTGTVVGHFSIKAGSSTGTVTYNENADSAVNRHGSLSFHASGTSDNNNQGNGWTVNKIGWISGMEPQGAPNELTWNVAFNSASANIGTVTITDTLGPGQTYIPGSVYAPTGSYDAKGNFIPDSGTLTPTVSVNGSEITFTFSNVTKAVDMTYKTKPTLTNNEGKWTNTASASNGGSVSATVTWGGSGTGTGEEPSEVTLTKTASDGTKLPDAIYKLEDSLGQVMFSALKTDENGQINLHMLTPGDYTLTEVTAPDGYELNTTPIKFTVVAGQKPIQLNAVDPKTTTTVPTPDKGSLLIKKTGMNGVALPGAAFTLKAASGEVIKAGLETDANGEILLPDLAAGTYTLIETKAPAGYTVNSAPLTIEILADGHEVLVPIKDQQVTGGSETPTPNPQEPQVPGVTPPTKPIEPTTPGVTPPTKPIEPTTPGVTPPTKPIKPITPGVTPSTKPIMPPTTGTTQPGVTGSTSSVNTPSGGMEGNVRPIEHAGGRGAVGQARNANRTAGMGAHDQTMTRLPQTNEQISPCAAVIGLVSLLGVGVFGRVYRHQD
ncbi:SpaA isopeptide-forming pilin-related protein [Levilactobacillus brevis]|uniref:SpaA isopeptide-forming pilin-related protein n=1 Tax=Levilactobacillus brevis TaxID=1580 RepID=UPI000BE7CA27|nr:SpaA isopeptide-forming pilin-related protein [Levilactobacillus brevis]MCZ2120007.1 Ig-like domain-containing protein [Levilactobacillus brevis]MCZ2125472.1 Ig-like domain-containing protein [Levilactobacillus brevis]MCZ2209792.1 Ig-like domain-containing protein [Levilactobacillus brevis]MCZ2325263.1 Ig-like domain-containing protein [Levilactobacillus brevis]